MTSPIYPDSCNLGKSSCPPKRVGRRFTEDFSQTVMRFIFATNTVRLGPSQAATSWRTLTYAVLGESPEENATLGTLNCPRCTPQCSPTLEMVPVRFFLGRL